MATQCPKCKAENPDESKFCNECGLQIDSIDQMPAPPTQTLEAPREELTTGSTFAGRYQIIEELGKGGMGKVYKANDTDIKEKVAIKLIKPEISTDKKTIERFQNELKFTRKIRHKNVCQMYDLNKAEGSYYITMEYVEGENLKSMIRMSGQLGIGTAISIAKQVCDGLTEAHELGVIHRDLKPSNIMIDREGSVRIMDFGIARSLKEKGITGSGVMIGTPEYMSPEQVEGKEVDKKSDIYSLGVILYEMVTGRVPFEGDTALTIAVKHKTESPKDPKELNTNLSDDLSRVILKCLEKDKEKRYQNAGELRSDLQSIEKGIPTREKVISEKKSLTSKEITVQFSLKKVFLPVLLILALAIIAVIIWQVLPEKEEVPIIPEKPSVAVLPFLDLSPQKDQEYFCDGMTDEIIARLSTFKEWKVIPRTSMMRYKNTEKDIKEIGAELNVSTILEGSMRKEGDDIRVNAKLIRIEDSNSLWSDTYDEKLKSIFAIQSDVAERIAEALTVELTPEEKERLEKNPTENLTAYDYYLKGRQYYLSYRNEDNELAIELFKKALEFDPEFALAYAGLGDSYAQRTAKFGFSSKWLDESIHAAKRAISLDPNLSEGYKALGLAYSEKSMYRKGIESNEKAIELNPSNTDAITNLGYGYINSGNFEKAFEYFRRAFIVDPTDPWNYINFGFLYTDLDDYAKAEHYLKTALDLQPHNYVVNVAITFLYLSQGKNQQAIDHSQRWLLIDPNNHDVLSYAGQAELFAGNYEQAQNYYQKSLEIQLTKSNSLGLGYINQKRGKVSEAQKFFNQSLELCEKQIEQGDESFDVPYNIAAIHAIQGNKMEAYNWLKKAIDAGWPYFRFGERDPMFENISNEERFKQMMAGVKKKIDDMRKKIEQKEKQE